MLPPNPASGAAAGKVRTNQTGTTDAAMTELRLSRNAAAVARRAKAKTSATTRAPRPGVCRNEANRAAKVWFVMAAVSALRRQPRHRLRVLVAKRRAQAAVTVRRVSRPRALPHVAPLERRVGSVAHVRCAKALVLRIQTWTGRAVREDAARTASAWPAPRGNAASLTSAIATLRVAQMVFVAVEIAT